jgi:hypothetical protein
MRTLPGHGPSEPMPGDYERAMHQQMQTAHAARGMGAGEDDFAGDFDPET